MNPPETYIGKIAYFIEKISKAMADAGYKTKQ
jgi:hypothetical protein